jgi:glycosyltransferase involved in cell wall biosynthesis
MPAFNRAAIVRRAVASVVAQTVADWELIIVDDASSDDLRGALAAIADPRLRVIHHECNQGAAAARNTGIAAARASLIAFIDSDDEWLPPKLARQLAAVDRAGASLGGLCTGFTLRRTRTGYSEDRRPSASGNWAGRLLDGCFVSPGTTLLARRECFDSVGLLDTGLRRFEDWDWLLRLTEHYEFDCLPDVLAIVHAGEPPPAAMVTDALRALDARQSARIRARAGTAGLRRFRASLALERAHAAIGAGRPFAAVAAAAEATLLSPRRAAVFLGRGFGRLAAGDV